MSGSGKPGPEPPGGGDPSMEDILASIRRILSEEEQAPPAEHPAPEKPPEDDELMLEPSMLVSPETAPPGTAAKDTPIRDDAAAPGGPVPAPSAPEKDPNLVAPEAARAAAASVAGLVRTLASERSTQTHSGGPTIEDLVRAELRPILKDWLDRHLPALVERLVRAEIERVVGRAAP